MVKPKISNPGDYEAMEQFRGAPAESAAERNERVVRVYGGILLVVCILVVIVALGLWFSRRLHAIGARYQNAVQDKAGESLLPPSVGRVSSGVHIARNPLQTPGVFLRYPAPSLPKPVQNGESPDA